MKQLLAAAVAAVVAQSAIASNEDGMPPTTRELAVEYVATMFATMEAGYLNKQEALWGACWAVLTAPKVEAYRTMLCGASGDYSRFPPMPEKFAQINARLPAHARVAMPLKTPATHPDLFPHLVTAKAPEAAQPVQPQEQVSSKSFTEILGAVLSSVGQAAILASAQQYQQPAPVYVPPPVFTPIYPLTYQSIVPGAPASTYTVNGYFRSNGTYVSPYLRTYPDGVRYNNLSPRKP